MKLFLLISFSSLHLITASKSPFELDKIDTDDFKTLAENNVLIDKTSLIRTGILVSNNYGKSVIIHRPPGWGKSTFMSMIDYFFRIEMDDKGNATLSNKTTNNTLFSGGTIKPDPNTQKIFRSLNIVKCQTARPVLHLKLKNVTGATYKEIRDEIQARIWDVFEQYSNTEYGDGEFFFTFWNPEDSFIEGLSTLGGKLYKYFNSDIITLIDDYEAPLINAYLDSAINLKRSTRYVNSSKIFTTATTLKNNDYQNTVIFTGVLDVVVPDSVQFRKESKTPSYLNHTDYAFLTQEIDQLVNRSSNQVDAEEMKKWCCGTYDFFDKPSAHQPRASMRYLAQNGKQTYYQSNSSIGRLVDKILSSEDLQYQIQSLIPINASIYHPVHPKNQTNHGIIPLYPLDGLSILYHCGYLRTQESPSGENHLTITTNEARYFFQTKVLQWLVKKFGIDCDQFQSFANLLSSGDLARFKTTLGTYICVTAEYIQQGDKEAKMIFNGLRIALCHVLSSTHDIKFIKQDVQEKDLGFVNEVLTIPKFGPSNTSVIIKQKSTITGTYSKPVSRINEFKAAAQAPHDDFYHKNNYRLHHT
ncbi:hypothetical protein U1Q18_049812, partial [Sarracenia purpurea var. burkii]